MGIKIIDIAQDLDHLSRDREEHRRLALGQFLKDSSDSALEQDIPLVSAGEGEQVTLRVPLLREHRFTYAFPPFGEQGEGAGQSRRAQGAGSANAESCKEGERTLQKGDVIGDMGEGNEGSQGAVPRFRRDLAEEGKRDSTGHDGEGLEKGGPMAGSERGQDSFEVSLSIDDLRDSVAEEFELPPLDLRPLKLLQAQKIRRPKGYRKKGPNARLSDTRTVERYTERQGSKESEGGALGITPEGLQKEPFIPEDETYRRSEVGEELETAAAIIFINDGSMSINETKRAIQMALGMHIARAWRREHTGLVVAFVAFRTEAEERSEWEFFHLKSSGGTRVSKGVEKAHEIINTRHSPDQWNIITVLFSDGENQTGGQGGNVVNELPDDMPDMFDAFGRMCEVASLFAYFEILPGYDTADRTVGARQETKALQEKYDNFVPYIIKNVDQSALAIQALIDAIERMKRKSVNV